MSTTPPATPSTGQAVSKQDAFDAANALLATATSAASNPANTPEARQAAFDLRTATSAQLTVLDQAVISSNTVALEAGAADLSPGMTQLKDLQKKIAGIGNGIKEGTSIVSQVDKVISAFTSLGL